MNKQDKTFWSLTTLDKLYIPGVNLIEELEIFAIEKHGDGLRIKHYYSSYIIINDPRKTTFQDVHKVICVNKEKAIEIQKELRATNLKYLKRRHAESLAELNEFVEKYFLPK